MRTGILAEKLLAKGHEVLWWTSAFDHFQKDWQFQGETEVRLDNNLKIKAIRGTGYKRNLSLARFIDHRIIARKFRRSAAQMPQPDIIVTSLPPHDLAWEAVRFAKINDVPVLVDIRDPWPDLFLEHVPIDLQGVARALLWREFWKMRQTMEKATGILAVCKAFLEWGLKYARRDRSWTDRVFYLGYQKRQSFSRQQPKFGGLLEKLRGKFVVFFVGTLSRSYHNPSILLEAASKLSAYPDIHFVIAGAGELFNEISKLARDHENVTLTGWLDQDEIETFLKYAKVGVCPSTKVVDLPTNKAFTYLSGGLPIISAFHGELKNIIERNGVGLYYTPNNSSLLVEAIKRLYEETELYKRMSQNAVILYEKQFNADVIYDTYLRHIEEIYSASKNKVL